MPLDHKKYTHLPGEVIIHPVSLCALMLWAINDHYGKGVWPGWLSGKLSDVVSLIVFPLIPTAIYELAFSRWGSLKESSLPTTHSLQTDSSSKKNLSSHNLSGDDPLIHPPWTTYSFYVCIIASFSAALVMLGINIWPMWAEAYEVILGAIQWPFYLLEAWIMDSSPPALHRVSLTMDSTDLITLPAALIPLWLHRRVYTPMIRD